MKINNTKITAEYFAYDGCHKIYLLEDDKDIDEAYEYQYYVHPISKIKLYYEKSCPLRFISNWKLTKHIVPQFTKKVVFDYD